MIYGDRDPGDLISKMNSRRDKYDISGKVHISVGEKEIYRMMKEYDGVIIWDLPANIRNRYLKHCFAHSIRCYLSPKICLTHRFLLRRTWDFLLSSVQQNGCWILLFRVLES